MTDTTHNPNDDKTFRNFQNYWPWATILLFLFLLSSGVIIKYLADAVSAHHERRLLKKLLKVEQKPVKVKDDGFTIATLTGGSRVRPMAYPGSALLPAPVVASQRA